MGTGQMFSSIDRLCLGLVNFDPYADTIYTVPKDKNQQDMVTWWDLMVV